MTKGVVVLAQNNEKDNYVEQACLLAMSVEHTNPGTKVSIITDDEVPEKYKGLFDQIIPIPFGSAESSSRFAVENRWKIYHASPYEETIVMDTDMLVLQDISAWWDFLSNYEMYFVSNVLTYRGEKVTSDYYRKMFVANDLPMLYAGFHYFKKCDFSHEFYKWVELITNNWNLIFSQFIKEHYPGHPSMDAIMAIATIILDCEHKVTNKKAKFPTFTHMKPHIQNWVSNKSNWQDQVGVYITRNCELKIGNHLQSGIFHYTEKDFANERIINRYRNKLNV